MKYKVSKNLIRKYPSFRRGVIIASKVKNKKKNESLNELFLDEMRKIQYGNTEIDINDERILAWQNIYDSFPIRDRRKVKPSVQALISRIKSGKLIPFISPLVCISNMVSLKFLNPGGLIDADKVKGNVCLGYANGTELYYPFGRDKPINPEKGEIIFFDDESNNVMCAAWNSKGGKTTMILPDTTRAIIDIDTLLIDEYSKENLMNSLEFAEGLIQKYCMADTYSFILGGDVSEREIIFS